MSGSTPGTSRRTCGPTTSRRSWPPAAPTASIPSPSSSRWRRPATTPAAGAPPTRPAPPPGPAPSHGSDPAPGLARGAPPCHSASGGVATDLHGRTDVPGLSATGEVACSGVHGANRLASNSLLEGLVFSRRIATYLMDHGLPPRQGPLGERPGEALVGAGARSTVQHLMTAEAGVLRREHGLERTVRSLEGLFEGPPGEPGTEAWETTNLATLGIALAGSALLRRETRGSHWREDH